MGSAKELIQELSEFEDSPEGWAFDLRLSFADIILKHLREHDWTQKRLAEEAGMKEPYITRLIHGDANCQLDTVGRILYALGAKADLVELDRIVGDSAFNTGEFLLPYTLGNQTPWSSTTRGTLMEDIQDIGGESSDNGEKEEIHDETQIKYEDAWGELDAAKT